MVSHPSGVRCRDLYISDEDLMIALRVLSAITYRDVRCSVRGDDDDVKRTYESFQKLVCELRRGFVDYDE